MTNILKSLILLCSLTISSTLYSNYGEHPIDLVNVDKNGILVNVLYPEDGDKTIITDRESFTESAKKPNAKIVQVLLNFNKPKNGMCSAETPASLTRSINDESYFSKIRLFDPNINKDIVQDSARPVANIVDALRMGYAVFRWNIYQK